MPIFALRPSVLKAPIVGLIARGEQVKSLSHKLAQRDGLMLAMGDDWLAAFSFESDVNLPWLPDHPTYLYAVAPGLLCQSGFEPDLPAPLLPALVSRFASQGAVAMTQGPQLWDFSAATPLDHCNLKAIR